MAEITITVKCPRCDHTWYVNTADLDEEYHVIYRDGRQMKPETKTYRVPCPVCRTYVILEIEPGGGHG